MTGQKAEQIALGDIAFTLPIAILAARIDGVCGTNGWITEEWEEDGLGTAHGLALRLESGRVVYVYELDHAIAHLGAPGPTVYMEGGDRQTGDLIEDPDDAAALEEALAGMGLTQADVAWRRGEEWKPVRIDSTAA